MDIETMILIIFLVVDVCFLGVELYFRRKELSLMTEQTNLMKSRKRRKNKDNPSRRN